MTQLIFCPACKQLKAIEEFSLSQQKPQLSGGRRCKECARLATRLWIEANPDRHRENQRRRNKEKRPEINEYIRQRYASSESVRKSHTKWAANNPEKRREIARSYASRARDNLSDAYVALTLEAKVSELPSELIETKRLVLKIKRLLKENK